MHAVSIQEVTSLADSYDLPLICADLQVSIKQSMGASLQRAPWGQRELAVREGGEARGTIWHLFFDGGTTFIFCKSAYHKAVTQSRPMIHGKDQGW